MKSLSTSTKSLILATGIVAASAGAYIIYRSFLRKGKREPSENIDESSDPTHIADTSGSKVLVLGLEKCGKTCLLAALTHEEDERPYNPTQGFNVVCITNLEQRLNIMEIGGSDKYRPHWSKFVKDTVLLLYLIDSSDAASLQSSLDALYIILQVKELDGAEVIIVFTKTDNELDGFVDETMRELNSGRFGRTGFLYTGVQVQSGGAPSTKGIIELQQRLLECVAGSKVVNR